MSHLTESQVRDAQREAADLRSEAADRRSEAADLRERAERKNADMQEEGVNPLKDKDAFETLDDMWKRASQKEDEATALERRAARATENLRGDRESQNGPTTRDASLKAFDDLSVGERVTRSENYERASEEAPRDLAVAARAFGSLGVMDRGEFRDVLTRGVTINHETLIEDDRKGIVNEHPFRPVRALDLITIGQTDSDTVDTIKEDSPTENVAEAPYGSTPEGSNDNVLSESSYGWSEVTYSVKRVGHYVPLQEGELADAAQLETKVDTRVRGGVDRRLEELVLTGDSASDAWDGIYNTSGIETYARDTGNDESRHDAVHRGITKIRVANESAPGEEAEPTVIGIHPEDWESVVLEKDADGNYLNSRGLSLPNTLWGLRPVISTAFTKGSPLVGDYAVGATLWMNEGVSVSMTDSHKDWFLRGWLALKAQTRAAFGVTVPRAFATVTSF